MTKSVVFVYLQAVFTVLALFLNSFLIYVIVRHTKSSIGAYKYVLICFAAFEMTYAMTVLVGMPINYIAEKSWIVFNFEGIIGNTSFNWLGPAFYCTFYELWMGLVVVHFVYRYIVVCKVEWKQRIQETFKYKVLIILIYGTHFMYAVMCGMYYCTRSEISKGLQNKIKEDFGVNDTNSIGYILLRVKDLEGELSPGGIISIFNHYLLVVMSVIIIAFTGFNIWRSIRKMQKESVHLREVNLQRQMFITLLIQTFIPLVLCHIPTLIYLVGTLPVVPDDFSFGAISSIFSFLTTIPKVLDPLVVLLCIREYRYATKKIIGLKPRPSSVAAVTSTSGHKYVSHAVAHYDSHKEISNEPATAMNALRRGDLHIHGI